MMLTSIRFALFFIVSLIVYYIVPKRVQWVTLLIFSTAFFLLSSTPKTGLYLLICVLVTWFCANQAVKAKIAGAGSQAKAFLILGIIINVEMLALLKYSSFFIFNANRLFRLAHLSITLPELNLAAPLGVSFYTFTALGYLLDSYWGIAEVQANPLKTALFIGYYPQLTSGPISRYREMRDQLYTGHKFDYETVTFGLQRMLWGVFKKLVISARLGIMVDTIYSDQLLYPGLYVWLAAVLFMLQLYTDFSGCMDIIIGASECYGIVLPENFRTPFFSRSVQEFWQRWHITLGGWMRDYVMYPIMRSKVWRKLTKWTKAHFGKKAAKQLPSYLAMLCVWLLMGLWHGGSWKYIIGMGFWFWGLIVLSQVCEPLNKKLIAVLKINTECFSWHLFQSLRVFVLVCIGNMFFRLDGLITTLRVMKAGLHWNPWIFVDGSLFKLGLDGPDFFVALFSLGILLLVSVLQEKGKSVRQRLAEQNLVFRWVVLSALILECLIWGMYGLEYDTKAFIYQGF